MSVFLYRDSFGRLPLHYAFVGTGNDASRDTSSTDPIAVVSILEQAMDKIKVCFGLER